MNSDPGRTSYVLVDGENIDATLGLAILKSRPTPEQRPRWARLLEFISDRWDQPAVGLFFLAVDQHVPTSFVQALVAMDYRPVLLAAEDGEKVVDVAIQRTLEALADREADVALVSNDGDFIPQLEGLGDGRRRAVIGFEELRNAGFAQLDDVELYDLEYDVSAFRQQLPRSRIRVVSLAEFRPEDYLGHSHPAA